MITIDTSAMLALIDRRSVHHERTLATLQASTRPYLVPAATLGELGYFFAHRFRVDVAAQFADDLQAGRWTLDCGDADLPRVRELVTRYADLPLGLVDAAVIACAEGSGGDVLSLDRDFEVVAREGTITLR